MNDPKYLFQYIQKLVVLNGTRDSVLLAKRKGENDYDGTFSFIGGKLETTDDSLIKGLQREKNEEIGEGMQVLVVTTDTQNVLFRKKDGNTAILPHYAALYVSGDINLSDEYSEYAWVKLSELQSFEPKIPNIPDMAEWAKDLLARVDKNEMTTI